VKRPSALETLKTLRQRQHESEQARLVRAGQLEKEAAENERRAREAVLGHTKQAEVVRLAEDERLGQQGISAAEGQRRLAWEACTRRQQEGLAAELQRAVERHQLARQHHDQMRVAVQQSKAALEQVEQRLERNLLAALRKAEQSQQETLDDAASRRFAESRDS
jgi:hypothetical protein